ncbi:MAG TPA: GAF domain-containing protein, partial [Longimicrobiaceae bacterium]|nr:GAF domain-containing protein [Longimicrobiaceae bacterium]
MPPPAPPAAADGQVQAVASEAYIGYDRAWRVVEMNEGGRAWTLRMGMPPEALMGRVLWDAFPGLCGTEFEASMRRAMEERVPVRFVVRSTVSSRWFETVAYPTADGLGAFSRDVTAGRLAERMHRLLAEAGRTLGDASLDTDATLSALTALAIPELADWCFVDEGAPDGGFTRMAVAHADPALGALAVRLRRQHGPPAATGGGAAIDWSRPLLVTPVTPQMLDSVARDDEHRAMLEELGLRSVIVVPLAARGTLIGTLLLGRSSTPEPYGPDDLALAEELARRASTALDTARLFHAAEVAVRRTTRLQEITASLSRATRVDEVSRVIVEQGVRAMDALSGAVLLLDASGRMLEVVYSVGYPDAALAQVRRIPVEGSFPAAEAFRTGAPVFASTLAERLERFPVLAPLATLLPASALAVIPLALDDARLGA